MLGILTFYGHFILHLVNFPLQNVSSVYGLDDTILFVKQCDKLNYDAINSIQNSSKDASLLDIVI